MTSQIIPVDPFDFIIFGGTGDLSERKLLPSLYHRQRDHQFSEPTRIIGTSRGKLSDDDFRAFAKKAILEHVNAEYVDQAELAKFLGRISYIPADAKSGNEIIVFQSKNGKRVRTRYDGDTLWLTVGEVAQLFGKSVSVITRHIANVVDEGELPAANNLQKMQVNTRGRPPTLCSLDMIISVGYRVSSKEATEFRISKDAITYALVLPHYRTMYESEYIKLNASAFANANGLSGKVLIGLPLLQVRQG